MASYRVASPLAGRFLGPAEVPCNPGGDVKFKGPIQAGTISAEFLADFSNEDPDLLIIGYSSVGGGATDQDRDMAAPGGQAVVELSLTESGILEIIVATGHMSDSGRLRVSRDGTLQHDMPVIGSAHWIYSVEA